MRDDHTLSYVNARATTDSESTELTVQKRRILSTGFVAHLGKECLSRRLTFGELIEVKACSGGLVND